LLELVGGVEPVAVGGWLAAETDREAHR